MLHCVGMGLRDDFARARTDNEREPVDCDSPSEVPCPPRGPARQVDLGQIGNTAGIARHTGNEARELVEVIEDRRGIAVEKIDCKLPPEPHENRHMGLFLSQS